jgi:hypothetical protein
LDNLEGKVAVNSEDPKNVSPGPNGSPEKGGKPTPGSATDVQPKNGNKPIDPGAAPGKPEPAGE